MLQRQQHRLPPPINISTQNVGGMRGEFQAKSGPKLATIRTLITPSTDFLVLTETRADHRAILNTKMRFDIRPSHYTASVQPRAGVVICAREIHRKLDGSERQSQIPGHIAGAVYEVRKSRTVIIGVYGISDNNDRTSTALINEISRMATELKLLYNTMHVIILGDFNAVLDPEDTHSGEIRKRGASDALHMLIERHQLTDLAQRAHKREHTWYKKGRLQQSSRIDMILTSIPMGTLRVTNTHTIFDHTYLAASLSQIKTDRTTPMKDYIVGSDEFLV